MAYKVYQWSSGTVGRAAAQAAVRRDSLELVGLHVQSADKAGRDIGELIGLEPLGIPATSDIEAIKASDADVVIHAPLPSLIYGDNPDQDLADFCELLAAGKNVITLVGYLYPKVHGPAVVERLEAACRAGNSSFHSSGLNPGWMGDLLPLTMSSLCERIDHIHVLEISNFEHYPSPEIMFDSMGFGSTPDQFAEKNRRQKTWLDALFAESLQLVADGLEMGVTEISSTLETVLADEDIKVAAGIVKAGTVAGQHWRWAGLADGQEVVAHETIWRMHEQVAPDWADGSNRIIFKGSPNMNLELPQNFAFMDNGMLATAMHAVNAIPYVVDAGPGIKTFLDLPWIFARK